MKAKEEISRVPRMKAKRPNGKHLDFAAEWISLARSAGVSTTSVKTKALVVHILKIKSSY